MADSNEATTSGESSFFTAVADELSVSLFGKPVRDLGGTAEAPAVLAKSPGYSDRISFARIYGAKLFGACISLPSPIFAIVPTESTPANDCGYSPEEFRMWTLPKGAPLVTLRHTVGLVDDIASDVKPFVDVEAAEASVHDIRLNGNILSGVVSVRLLITQKIFGHKVTLIDINRGFPFSFDISSATTVTIPTPIPGISCTLTFHLGPPRQLCGGIDADFTVWHGHINIACVNV